MVRDVASWLACGVEPASWAFGLPDEEAIRLVWCGDPALHDLLDRTSILHPPADPEREDTVEAFNKMRNAHHVDDRLGLHLPAQSLAARFPGTGRAQLPEERPTASPGWR